MFSFTNCYVKFDSPPTARENHSQRSVGRDLTSKILIQGGYEALKLPSNRRHVLDPSESFT